MLVKFLAVRISILSIILSVIAFVLFERNPAVLAGILIGGMASIYKIKLFSISLEYMVQNNRNAVIKSVIINFLSLTLTFVLLAIAVIKNVSFFYALSAGLLSGTAVICINAFTEIVGVTHNSWQ